MGVALSLRNHLSGQPLPTELQLEEINPGTHLSAVCIRAIFSEVISTIWGAAPALSWITNSGLVEPSLKIREACTFRSI